MTAAKYPSKEPIRRLREVLVYANRFLKVFDDDVEFLDGEPGRYLRLVPAGDGPGVVIIPLSDGTVGLVRSYRYPVADWQWALPRGFAQDLDPLVTARSELREELGIQDADLRILGRFTPDSGLLSNYVAVVAAKVHGIPDGQPEDHREIAAVRWIPIQELFAMVVDGKVEDGMTLAALTLAQSIGVLPVVTPFDEAHRNATESG
jgi:8-oxo-dGTP pyrophosphatase MutT (NUDIX family)